MSEISVEWCLEHGAVFDTYDRPFWNFEGVEISLRKDGIGISDGGPWVLLKAIKTKKQLLKLLEAFTTEKRIKTDTTRLIGLALCGEGAVINNTVYFKEYGTVFRVSLFVESSGILWGECEIVPWVGY